MYDEEYENEIIEQEFDDTGVVYEKPIELDIFAEDAWDDSALLADDVNLKYSYKLLPESEEGEKYTFSFWVNINNIPESAHWDSDVNIQKG